MGNIINFIENNKKPILTAVSCIGVGLTGYLGIKAGKKIEAILEEARQNGEPIDNKKDEIKTTLVYYIPTFIAGGLTGASIIFNHITSAKQLAALAAAYGASLHFLNDFKKHTREIVGQERYDDILRATVKDRERDIEKAKPCIGFTTMFDNKDSTVNGGNQLFYEPFSGIWFRSSEAAVINAEYHLNRNFSMRGFVDEYEFQQFLGITPIEEFNGIGYGFRYIECSGYGWIDFYHTNAETDDGEPYIIIDRCYEPEVLTDDDGI